MIILLKTLDHDSHLVSHWVERAACPSALTLSHNTAALFMHVGPIVQQLFVISTLHRVHCLSPTTNLTCFASFPLSSFHPYFPQHEPASASGRAPENVSPPPPLFWEPLKRAELTIRKIYLPATASKIQTPSTSTRNTSHNHHHHHLKNCPIKALQPTQKLKKSKEVTNEISETA